MRDPVDLRSDFLTRPTPAMRAAMMEAAELLAQFGLREDPLQRALEERVAQVLGTEDALFFPTCTMASETALLVLTQPGDRVLAQPDAHVVTSEAGAPSALAGVQVVPVPGDPARPPLAAWQTLASAPSDELKPRTSAIVLENTHNRAGGALLDVAYVDSVLAISRGAGIRAHLDGSRLFNAAVALGVDPARLCRGFDTVAISLNKGLGAPVGAMLAGTAETIARALVVRQRLGGGLRPTGILAAAALEAMRDWSHLSADHARARALAEGLAAIPALGVPAPATNIVLVDIEGPRLGAAHVCERLDAIGVKVLPFGPRRIRLVTYRDVTDADLARAIDAFRNVLSHVHPGTAGVAP